jgi:hypothetical protein
MGMMQLNQSKDGGEDDDGDDDDGGGGSGDDDDESDEGTQDLSPSLSQSQMSLMMKKKRMTRMSEGMRMKEV